MTPSNSFKNVVKVFYKIVIVDILALVALYYVLQDLQWRTDYAASLHTACRTLCGYSPSFSYGLLTRVFTMDGNSQHLVSPPTLDWVQAIVVTLVVANSWFVYAYMRERRRLHSPTQPNLTV